MFRRDFFLSGLVPFLGFAKKEEKPRKVQIVELKDVILYVDVDKKYVFKKIYDHVTLYYNEKKEFHREDGPAVEFVNGNKEWHYNGLPQIHEYDGYKYWVKPSGEKDMWGHPIMVLVKKEKINV